MGGVWRILDKLQSVECIWKPDEEYGWISQIENGILQSRCVMWGLHLNGPNNYLMSLYPPTVSTLHLLSVVPVCMPALRNAIVRRT